MATDRVAALFIVGRHSFAGGLDHHYLRVLDVLNDASAALLRLYGVAAFRGLHGKPISEFDEIVVPKAAIDCVILADERHEAPMRRQFALVEKRPHPMFVLLTEYEIRGTVMLDRYLDPAMFFNSNASCFFPIVSAGVSSVDGHGPPLEAAVAFVNRERVSLLHVDKREIAPPASK